MNDDEIDKLIATLQAKREPSWDGATQDHSWRYDDVCQQAALGLIQLRTERNDTARTATSQLKQLTAELTATNALVAAVAAAADGAWNEAVAKCETAIGTAFDKTGNIMDILKAVAALKRPTQSKPEPVIMPAWDDLPKDQKKDDGIDLTGINSITHWVSPNGAFIDEQSYTFVRNALQSLQKSKGAAVPLPDKETL